jgi:hypothetical protein
MSCWREMAIPSDFGSKGLLLGLKHRLYFFISVSSQFYIQYSKAIRYLSSLVLLCTRSTYKHEPSCAKGAVSLSLERAHKDFQELVLKSCNYRLYPGCLGILWRIFDDLLVEPDLPLLLECRK